MPSPSSPPATASTPSPAPRADVALAARAPRLRGLLDALLGPRFARHDADERRRARLIVGASALLALVGLLFAALLSQFAWGTRYVPIAVGPTVLIVASVWVLRRTGGLDRAALTLCLTVLGVVITSSWLEGGLNSDSQSWLLVVCAFAPMLLPPRLGLLCAGLVVGHLLALDLAARLGHVFPPADLNHVAVLTSKVLVSLSVAAFGLLQDRTRREALGARDAALASVEEGREARLALVENVGAVVFSVDRDLRLIASNSAFDGLARGSGLVALAPGRSVLAGFAEAHHADLRALFARALAGEHVAAERALALRAGAVQCEMLFNPIRRASGEVRGVTVLARDITARLRAAAELVRVNRALAEAAHLAGKAEVATDVLHNVGNVLATVTVTVDVLAERLQASRAPFLGKTLALLPADPAELARYLATDAKGRRLREYLDLLAESLEQERAEATAEVAALQGQLEHVKRVVARQQAHARVDGVVEVASVDDVLGEALRLGAAACREQGIAVTTETAGLPPLALRRHAIIEIVANLVANSRQALEASDGADKRIVVRAFRNAGGDLQIDVADNGVGIAPEHLGRLFTYGFTTRPDGHGFGLAGSLLAARASGGVVRAHSAGRGRGATFSLELPFQTTASKPREERAV